MLDKRSLRLKATPVQVIEWEDGVILKRGCTEAKLAGEGILEAIQRIFEVTAGEGATREEMCALFSPPARKNVEDLIEHLVGRGFLDPKSDADAEKPDSEAGDDIFYWQFGASASSVREQLATTKILVLGVNYISRQLVIGLQNSGFAAVQVLDHPSLRNPRLFDGENKLRDGLWPSSLNSPEAWSDDVKSSSFDCLIAASDFGTPQALLDLNQTCLDQGGSFLPIVLHNFMGQVGPLVIPKEGACFECLRSRQNANLDDPTIHRLIETVSVDRQDVQGFHPSMASILGEVSAFELTKFYSGVLGSLLVNGCIKVDLLAGKMTARKVLRIPRCPACSPLKVRPPTSASKSRLGDTARFTS